MKNKILIVMAAFMVLAYPVAAGTTVPGNSATPVIFDVKYVVTSTTTFSVTTNSPTASMDFEGNRSSKLLSPNGQVLPGTPWAIITNTGDVAQTFTAYLNTTDPAIQLYISNAATFAGKILVQGSPQSPAGWTNVPRNPGPGNTVNLFAYVNFSNAPEGTTVENLNIQNS